MPETIDWTKMLELFERVYSQALVMSRILVEQGYDHAELKRRFADPSIKAEVQNEFDLLFRASRGRAELEHVLRDFSKLRSTVKPN